jgi:hypothetical protein
MQRAKMRAETPSPNNVPLAYNHLQLFVWFLDFAGSQMDPPPTEEQKKAELQCLRRMLLGLRSSGKDAIRECSGCVFEDPLVVRCKLVSFPHAHAFNALDAKRDTEPFLLPLHR